MTTRMEDILVELIDEFGLLALMIFMFFKGLLIGKPIPAVFVISTYILLGGFTSPIEVLAIAFITAISMTIGAILLYYEIQNNSNKIQRYLPDRVNSIIDSDNNDKNSKFNKFLNKFNNNLTLTILVSNIITGVRGFVTIPAAQSGYPLKKFSILYLFTTTTYHFVLTLIVVLGFEIVVIDYLYQYVG